MAKKIQLSAGIGGIIRLTNAVAILIAGAMIYLTVSFLIKTLSDISSTNGTGGSATAGNTGIKEDVLERMLARQAERTAAARAPAPAIANPFVSRPEPVQPQPSAGTPSSIQ